MNIPLSCGASNDAVADEFVDTMARMAAIEKENQRRLAKLFQRDYEIGQASRAAVDVAIAQAQLSGSRLRGASPIHSDS